MAISMHFGHRGIRRYLACITRNSAATLIRGLSSTPNRVSQAQAAAVSVPEPHACPTGADEFWRRVPIWKDVTAEEFTSYAWSVSVYITCRIS